MKAITFPEPEEIVFDDVDDPSCQPNEVILKVATSGICGTDLHIYRNEYMSTFPLIPGHEFGGSIVEVGGAVSDLQVGDRVAVDPNLYCMQCSFCRREQANHCRNWQGVGITRPGGFAQYVAVPARACYWVPATLSDGQMAFIEPLACVVHGMQRLRIPPGDSALLFGAGPIGLLLLQALSHGSAAQVVVVDKQPARLQLAAELGAGTTLTAGPDLEAELGALAPDGFGVVVDATGVPAVIEAGFRYLRPRGQYLMFGVAPMDAEIRVRPYDIFRNDWQVIGSFALCYTFHQAIDWLEAGIIRVDRLISHTAPLSEFEPLFQEFVAGRTLKVHLQPW